MNNEFRYILEKKSRKHPCPGCGKLTFVRYIDSLSGELLPERYGRCDREVKCTYHLNPYKDGYGKEENNHGLWQSPAPAVTAAAACIPVNVLRQTLMGYEQNQFIKNLLYNVPFPFEVKDIENVIAQYFLGFILEGDRAGAVTFPFIDVNGGVRTIQVKEFDFTNHTTGTDFLHSILERSLRNSNEPLPDWLNAYLKNEKKVTCLFGDHLLKKYYHNPIALVEAPKTAVYGTLYFGFPDDPCNLLWMAVYNLSSLTVEKCQSLKGRHVYLFPDLSKDGKAFELWSRKARELSEQLPETFFKVSDLLEKEASLSERLKGSDLADFLIKQDWRKFRSQPQKGAKGAKGAPLNKTFILPDAPPKVEFVTHEKQISHSTKTVLTDERTITIPIIKEGIWEQDIKELELFFKVIPSGPIRLSECELITDPVLFIKSHLEIVKGQNGNTRYLPYMERLMKLKTILSN